VTATARRDLRLLAAGVGISTAGDSIALVALLLVLRGSGSGWVAALLAAQLVPAVVLAPLSGRLVDRHETRRVLLLAVAGQAVVAVPLALATAPWLIIALFTALASFTAVVRPATSALVPTIAGGEATPKAYARLAAGQGLGWIVGPALGGILTAAVGARGALLVDAGTFVALAAACLGVRARRPPRAAADGVRPRPGWSLLLDDRVLRATLTVSVVCTACAVVDNVAAPFRFIDQLGASSTGFGAYLALWGAGALLGSQVLPRIAPERHARTVAVGNGIMGVGIAGIGIAPGLVVAFAASAFGGIGNGLANVGQTTLVGSRVAEGDRGRAFAAMGASLQASVGLGTVAGGLLLALLAPGTVMLLCGLLAALAAAAGLVALGRRGEDDHRSTVTPAVDSA
jgi:predicted MFS family arabinose efflux permease